MYFLVIGCLQLDVFFPGLSPTHWSTTIGPLVVVLTINAVKEAYDDYFRHKSDDAVNASVVTVVKPRKRAHGGGGGGGGGGDSTTTTTTTTTEDVRWRDLKVGDVVRVKNNAEFPADIVLMQSSDATGVCYVETANLDGETNLKVKASAGVGVESGEDADAREVFEKLRDARVECEAPNNQLYKFEGKLVGVAAGVTEKVDAAATAGIEPAANDDDDDDDDASKDAVAPADVRRADGFSPTFFPREIPLGVDNVLLRGSTLRNTTWILGVVVFTGKDSKLMKNMTRAPHKVSQLERHMNLLVASIGLFQIVISATLAGTQQRWFKDEMEPKTHAGDAFRHWYLASTNEWPDVEGGVGAAFTQFIRYVVLLNALIPISLYVTLELVKVIQCGWIRCDRKLYDPIYDVRCGCARAFDLPSRSHPSRLSPPVESSAFYLTLVPIRPRSRGERRSLRTFSRPRGVPPASRRADPPLSLSRPRRVRTTTLNEELGQCQCVLTDKTGTLTQNVMAFVKCSVDGVVYAADVTAKGDSADDSADDSDDSAAAAAKKDAFVHSLARSSPLQRAASENDPRVVDFLTHLAVCHTVVPAVATESNPGYAGRLYQASSPDEEALVTGAAALGRRLVRNANDEITLEVHAPDPDPDSNAAKSLNANSNAASTETFEILAVNEFSSARKRMSVVARDARDGSHALFLKGADAVVLERLSESHDAEILDATRAHLDAFARDGLRTLVLSKRALSKPEVDAWLSTYRDASTALTKREELLERCADAIERDCVLVGATAVEDKLQDGVPDAIATLRAAGMLVWMLTGDKARPGYARRFPYSTTAFARRALFLEDGLSLLSRRRISPLTPRWFQSRRASTPFASASDVFQRHPDVASRGTNGTSLSSRRRCPSRTRVV